MPIEFRIRDTTPYLVNRKYGFQGGEGGEVGFLEQISSAGICQINVAEPEIGAFPRGPLSSTVQSVSENLRRCVLWLHTLDSKDFMRRGSDLLHMVEMDFCDSSSQDPSLRKGLNVVHVLDERKDVTAECLNLLQGLNRAEKMLRSLEHVELQLLLDGSVTPAAVAHIISMAREDAHGLLTGFSLGPLHQIGGVNSDIKTLSSTLEAAKNVTDDTCPLFLQVSAHVRGLPELLEVAANEGVHGISYGMAKTSQYNYSRPTLLPCNFMTRVNQLFPTSVDMQPDAYENAYRDLQKMKKYFGL